MRDYAPTYLTCVNRQFDGYPAGISTKQKAELEELIRQLLIKHGTLSMERIYQMIKDKASCLETASVWDWIWACIDRALRQVAEPVYQLSESERWKLQRKNRERKLDLLPLLYGHISSNERDREPGEKKEWTYSRNFCGAFPLLFGSLPDNYAVLQLLKDEKILTGRNNCKAETFNLSLSFSSEKAARSFVDRFNRWALDKLPERKQVFEILFTDK